MIALVPFCSGYVNGCVFSYMTSENGAKGAVGYFVMLWLPVFLQAVCMLYYSSVALKTSIRLFRHNIMGETHILCIKIKNSLYVFLIICLLQFAVSMISGVFIILFNHVFL